MRWEFSLDASVQSNHGCIARGKYRPSNFKNNIIELSWTGSDHDEHQPRERSRPSRVPTQRKIVAPVDFAAPRSTSHREGSAGETA